MQSGIINVVNKIKNKEIPSTPKDTTNLLRLKYVSKFWVIAPFKINLLKIYWYSPQLRSKKINISTDMKKQIIVPIRAISCDTSWVILNKLLK